MGVEFKSKFDPKKLADDVMVRMERELKRQMEFKAGEIVERTTAGKSVEGQTFRDYSGLGKGKDGKNIGYARWRQERGYQVKPPNITVTGHMLESLTSNVTRIAGGLLGTIKPTGPDAANLVRWNQALRDFFRLSKKQLSEITKALQRARK
jgi:hypothetical protein